MTEIKIPFIKTKVEKYSDSDKPANIEGLTLEVSSLFRFNEVYEKFPLNGFLEKMQLKFVDGAEKTIFNELLDDNKVNFELSFEKEKVNFWLVGEEEHQKDDTKLEIDCFLRKNDNNEYIKDANLQIEFEPQFSGIVKIVYKGPVKDKDKNSPPRTSELEKEITELKNQINSLKEKKNESPINSDESQDYERRIRQLEDKLREKEKEKEKTQKGDNFPWKPVIIGGLVVGGVIIVLVIILLLKNIIRKK